MTRYIRRGRTNTPLDDAIADRAIGEEFDADLDKDIEATLLGAGVLEKTSSRNSKSSASKDDKPTAKHTDPTSSKGADDE